jgi:hypothetical protein
VVLTTAAANVVLAVKNGPPGMWRALASPGAPGPIGRFAESPLWIVATTCAYLALALLVSRRARRETAPRRSALVIPMAVLGLLVVLELRVHSAFLDFLVVLLLVVAWVAVLLEPGLRRPGRHARR